MGVGLFVLRDGRRRVSLGRFFRCAGLFYFLGLSCGTYVCMMVYYNVVCTFAVFYLEYHMYVGHTEVVSLIGWISTEEGTNYTRDDTGRQAKKGTKRQAKITTTRTGVT